jgi:hypothetical protein
MNSIYPLGCDVFLDVNLRGKKRLNSGTASNLLHFTNGTGAMIAQGCQYCVQTGQKYTYMSELSSITKMCPASQQYVTLLSAICNIALCRTV